MTELAQSMQNTTWLHKVKGSLAAWAKFVFGGIFLALLALVAIDIWVSYSVRDKIYTDLNQLPTRPYGLVLGTSKYYSNNAPNLYYKYRLESAKLLFSNKKVNYLLLSGDSSLYYNEPKTMTKDLKKMDIPERFLFQDFAGFRTLDSVVRAEKVFQAGAFTIISQKFHCERALFIAKYHNINAICYVAKYPDGHIKVRLREFLARPVMLLDLALGRQPSLLEMDSNATK